MHYEMEVFDIYSTPVSIEKGENLSTRIRKVISTIKDTTPVPFHKPASEEETIYRQLSYHNPGIRIPVTEIQYVVQFSSS
ncbi:hypothetical protein GBAR_LOCUS27670 [Geodia barretti]|uniref:Uncharacterized protein n=1 Tax=Geodia barretti TaxID=519541 RepID=A0AA35XFE2_GEOBA|nr:hypothetical protein GBAR_LOCUS27670 [Geodia barretti]